MCAVHLLLCVLAYFATTNVNEINLTTNYVGVFGYIPPAPPIAPTPPLPPPVVGYYWSVTM